MSKKYKKIVKNPGLNNIEFGLVDSAGKFYDKEDRQILKERKKFLREHGYSPVATWEINSWFEDTMYDVLVRYRKDMHGYPTSIIDEEEWGSPITDKVYFSEEYNNACEKKWNDIIDEMISALKNLKDWNYPDYDQTQSQEEIQQINKEAFEKREEYKQKFFNLFVKYYDNLWD